MVCKVRVPAGETGKSALIGTITFVDVATDRARARRIPGINQHHRDADQLRFVADLGLQIVKRPIRMSCPLFAPNRDPVPYALQILQGDTSTAALRFLHDLFADAVVCVPLVTLLLAAHFAQFTLGGSGAFALQVPTTMPLFAALFLNGLAAVGFAVAVHGQIDNAEVYAKHVIDIGRFPRFDFAGNHQVEHAGNVAQIRLTPFAIQQLALAFTARLRHPLSPRHCPDAHGLLGGFQAQDAAVVGECTTQIKNSLDFLVPLVGLRDLANCPDGYLSGQAVLRPNGLIRHLVQCKLAKNLFRPGHIADLVTSSVCRLKCFEQHCMLVGRGQQFDLGCQLHGNEITSQQGHKWQITGGSSTRLKARVSATAD